MPEQTTTVNGRTYGDIVNPSVGSSPWTFTNTENCPILFTVSGGTVLSISMAPSLLGLVNLGVLGGSWPLNPGHVVQISYILPPSAFYWPM